MKRGMTAAGVAILAALVSSGCSSGTLGYAGAWVMGGYFRPSLNATFRVDEGLIPGDEVNLEGVADIPGDADAPFAAAMIGLGGLKISLSGWMSSVEGTTNATATFTFGGSTFTAGVPLLTELDLNNASATFEYSVSPWEYFNLSIGLGVDLFDVDLRMRQPSLSLDESLDEIAPIPVIAAGLEVTPTEYLTLFAQVRGLAIDSEFIGYEDDIDANVQYVDLWVGLRGRWEYVVGTIGYKLIDLDAAVDEYGKADVTFHGLVVTIGAHF